MAIIEITRSEQWSNQTTSLFIYIDNEKVGSLRFGETRDFEVTPGKHKVVAKNSWVSSSQPLEVEVSDNEKTTIKLSSFKYGWLIPFVFIILVGIFHYLILSYLDFNFNPLIIIPVPFILYGIYHVIYGRKIDLKLELLQ